VDFSTRNNAKVRETTCGYANGVDAINTPRPRDPAPHIPSMVT
jgi:hypothetical protein